ncbi:MAG TPA: hypothetical protein VGJ87_13630 [Roseiflexaceae bacterium]|jgi:hypothetical protein
MSRRKYERSSQSRGKPTRKTALIVTGVSLVFLILDALLSIWGDGFWSAAGGMFGIIGISGLALALVIALFAGRR